jgi:hypothetical protein
MTRLVSEKIFQPLLGTVPVPARKVMIFPEANSDLKICLRLFSLLLHKNE